MTDRLTLAHALEQGGIARDAAESIATEIYDAIRTNVATKADIAALQADLAALENRMLWRLGRMIAVATTGLVIAATATATGVILHYLPHA
ncbi:MAG TPA: hypothetical protein VEQ62_17905 [Stellaceae bacterium]|jgi:hypothetical protein|nr:hypothetical protein [Stellaceae bacterium]